MGHRFSAFSSTACSGVTLAALVALACGCQEHRSPSAAAARDSSEAAEPAAPGPIEAEPSRVEPAPPKPALIAEEQVRALLDTWLAAQNEADFDRYQPLYASRFTGIKRAGARTRTYDRGGWLADRGRMFEEPMSVSVADVDIQTGVRTAVVRFEQTWASGDFKDIGPKLLVVVREDGEPALRIAREEMLYSTVLSAGGAGDAPSPAAFAFSLEVAGERYLLLARDPEDDWGQGAPTLVQKGRPFLARRAVDPAALPPAQASYHGQTFLLAGRPECAATVAELVLLGGAVPHFGTVEAWARRTEADGAPTGDDDAIARELWDMGEHILAGRLEAPAGCGGLWAHRDDAAPVTAWSDSSADSDAIIARALDAFRELPGYRALAREYERTGHAGAWDEHDGAAPVSRVFSAPDGDRTVVLVAAHAGDGCGDWAGDLWAAWEVDPGGRLRPLTPEGVSGHFIPEVALDLGADGVVELLGRGERGSWNRTLLRRQGRAYRAVERFAWPDFDCSC